MVGTDMQRRPMAAGAWRSNMRHLLTLPAILLAVVVDASWRIDMTHCHAEWRAGHGSVYITKGVNPVPGDLDVEMPDYDHVDPDSVGWTNPDAWNLVFEFRSAYSHIDVDTLPAWDKPLYFDPHDPDRTEIYPVPEWASSACNADAATYDECRGLWITAEVNVTPWRDSLLRPVDSEGKGFREVRLFTQQGSSWRGFNYLTRPYRTVLVWHDFPMPERLRTWGIPDDPQANSALPESRIVLRFRSHEVIDGVRYEPDPNDKWDNATLFEFTLWRANNAMNKIERCSAPTD